MDLIFLQYNKTVTSTVFKKRRNTLCVIMELLRHEGENALSRDVCETLAECSPVPQVFV